jgi:hypothetical protein
MPIDPEAAAKIAESIIRPIIEFLRERRARKDLTHRDLVEWLENNRHEEIKELITHTFHLQTQVDDLLRQDHAEILAKLDRVERSVLSKIGGFATLTSAISLHRELSTEAVVILQWLHWSGQQGMMTDARGNPLMGDKVLPSRNRPFLKNDLDSLVFHGFISAEAAKVPANTMERYTIYGMTRKGAEFLKSFPDPRSDFDKLRG